MKPNHLQQQIDQQLKSQYHQICFNPARKQDLMRLTSRKTDYSENYTNRSMEKSILDNEMLNQYISNVYRKYEIEDPIIKQFRLAKLSPQKYQKTPNKSLNLTSVEDSDKITKTKRKLINLKESFKRDSDDIVYSRVTNRNSFEGSQTRQSSRLRRQIGYKTKEKIYFKAFTNERKSMGPNQPIVKHLFLIQNPGHPTTSITFNSPEYRLSLRKRQVPVKFRYCPMCQEMTLEHNIQFHESICKQVQKAYNLPYSEVQSIIYDKIIRMQGEIRRGLSQYQDEIKRDEQNQIHKAVSKWIENDSLYRFQSIKLLFHKNTLNLYDKIIKYDWFRNLHSRILKQKRIKTDFT